jgi:hypothetical protein
LMRRSFSSRAIAPLNRAFRSAESSCAGCSGRDVNSTQPRVSPRPGGAPRRCSSSVRAATSGHCRTDRENMSSGHTPAPPCSSIRAVQSRSSKLMCLQAAELRSRALRRVVGCCDGQRHAEAGSRRAATYPDEPTQATTKPVLLVCWHGLLREVSWWALCRRSLDGMQEVRFRSRRAARPNLPVGLGC